MYYDLLVKIKNAAQAKKEGLQTRFSIFDFAVLKALHGAGFIHDVQKKNVGKKSFLDIKLRYEGGKPAITGVRFLSKPGRRAYVGYRDVKAVRQGYGVSVLSTPSGVMTNRDARKKKVGGEYLFEIW